MVYNPARIAQGYLKGKEYGEQSKIRGLDQARIKREDAAKAKAAAKTAEIEGLTSRYAQGDVTAEQGLMEHGSEGLAAAQTVRDYQLGQTEETRATTEFEQGQTQFDQGQTEFEQGQETLDRETSDRELTESLPRALTITDPAEWDQFEAWARPRSLAAGTSPEMYDQIAAMPMVEAQAFLREQMEGKPDAAPSGGLKNVEMPDGTQSSFDITNPEQRAAYQEAIAAGGVDMKTRAVVDTVEGFDEASGGKSEQKTLNEMAAGVNTLSRNLSRAVTSLKVEPASGMIVGDVAVFADNMASNLSALVGNADMSAEDLASDIAEFSGVIEPIAAATSELNSALIDAAYAKALIQNGARPTDADFKSAYKSLTGGSQNPKVLIKNLTRADKDLQKDFKFRYRQSTGKDWGGKFDNEKVDYSGMTAAELGKLDMKSMTPEEIDAAEAAWDKLNATK